MNALADEIVKKANRVFLRFSLTVNRFLDGQRGGDATAGLQRAVMES